MTNQGDPPRRVLLAAGTATYRHADTFAEGLENLDVVPEALHTVVDALSRLGYEPQPGPDGPFLLDPDLEVLEKAMHSAAQKAQVAVIYYTGHGLKPDRHPYYILTADSTGSNLNRTALEPRDLLIHLLRYEQENGSEQPEVLVILDCCYSGAGGAEILRDSLQGLGNPNVWVLASASHLQEAQQCLFAQAFAAALRSPKIGHSTEFVPFDLLLGEVNRALALHRPDQQARLIRGEVTGIPPFLPNREHVPAVAGLTVEEQVWVGRLRGAPEDGTATGFYITGTTGRVRAVEDIADWMRSPADHGLAVVTGSPGSGKSTLLALPVLLAGANRTAELLAGSAPDSLPARAAGLFAGLSVHGIYARGMDPYQATKAIGGHLKLQAKRPWDLIDGIQRREATPQIMVIDAVDESVDPKPLMDTLLLPLARCSGMKVLIGTRRHLIPQSGDSDEIGPSGDFKEKGLLVDLDADHYRDPQALTAYARQLLRAVHEPEVRTPYRDASDEITTAVAEAIGVRATAAPSPKGKAESFLLAQLLARAVRARERVPDVVTPGWADRLPTDVGAALDEDLARLEQREGTIRALLTALTWAQGPGLPWENIWVPVARALAADDPESQPIDDSDVRWLLDNAGGYVVEDLGPGQRSVFRPFHELLAAHLHGEPGKETRQADPATGKAWPEHGQRSQTSITRALLDTVRADPRGRPDWELAHPYLRTYLARHARAAGPETFARLVADPDYLAVAAPGILTPLLTPTDPALRPLASVYRRARPLLGTDPGDNAAYLQEAFVAVTGHPPASQHIQPSYHTLMTRTRHDDSLLTLTGHGGPVESVAFCTRADGRPLLATGSRDGTVRLWDPDTGAQTCKPLNGHGGRVDAVAFGTRADGQTLLAIAGWDGTVRLSDPETGTEAGTPLTHGSRITSIAFGTRADGQLLLATAGWDGTVRLYQPGTGAAAGAPLTGHDSWVSAVAFGIRTDGRPLLATAGWDGAVRLWDPDTRTEAAAPLTGHNGQVSAVAFGSRADGRLLLASACWDGTVRLWDPDRGTEASPPLTGHGSRVTSVTFARADGRPLLATGSRDGTARLWDPDRGTAASPRLTGYDGRAEAVACGTRADGRLLLASAVTDGTVRLLDPETGTEAVASLSHNTRVSAVAFANRADGRLLLATGCQDGTVRLWDAETGAEAGTPLGHGGPVSSVAFGTRTNGQLLLASAVSGGTLRLWDPETGTEAGRPLGHGGPVSSVAFGTRANGQLLLASAGGNGTVRFWDPETGTEAGVSLDHGDPVISVAFGTMPDGRLLLASAVSGGTVQLWNSNTGTAAGGPLDHGGPASVVAFGTRADGRPLLATGSWDGTVRLLDPDTGTILATLRRHTRVNLIALHRAVLAIADDEGITALEIPHTA